MKISQYLGRGTEPSLAKSTPDDLSGGKHVKALTRLCSSIKKKKYQTAIVGEFGLYSWVEGVFATKTGHITLLWVVE